MLGTSRDDELSIQTMAAVHWQAYTFNINHPTPSPSLAKPHFDTLPASPYGAPSEDLN